MTRKRIALGLAVLLGAAGLWLVGGGLYIHAKAALAQILLSRAWAATQEGEGEAKPWPWADTWPVARLRVPSRDVDQIVLAGGSGRTLAFAPGHVAGTAAPGAPGVSVIGGHRDTHFRFLADLERGDLVVVERPDGTARRYRVDATAVAHKDRARAPAPDGSLLVLATCWPFDAVVPGGPLRFIVFAVPDYPPLAAAR